MKPFKIRCSAIGSIMAGAVGLTEKQAEQLAELQAKPKPTDIQKATLAGLIQKRDNPELPAGAKTYCKEWYISERLGIKKDVASKYLDKGIEMEDAAIARYTDGFGSKWAAQLEDEHFTGTPDLVFKEMVADIKCPYDPFTMPYFETECPNPDYFYQLQVYMHLTGKKRAELVYCLENTPPRGDWDEWVTYDHIPDADRIRIFKFDYDPAIIAAIQARVEMCRAYIQTLDQLFNNEQPQ